MKNTFLHLLLVMSSFSCAWAQEGSVGLNNEQGNTSLLQRVVTPVKSGVTVSTSTFNQMMDVFEQCGAQKRFVVLNAQKQLVCQCEPDEVGGAGNCVSSPPKCLNGAQWDGSACVSICPAGEIVSVTGGCVSVCEQDQYWDTAKNECVFRCADTQNWNGTACVELCAADQELTDIDETGAVTCVDRCAASQTWDGSACVERCAAEQRWDGSACVDRCAVFQRWDGSACVHRCAANQAWDGSACVERCAAGLTWNGMMCVCIATSTNDCGSGLVSPGGENSSYN